MKLMRMSLSRSMVMYLTMCVLNLVLVPLGYAQSTPDVPGFSVGVYVGSPQLSNPPQSICFGPGGEMYVGCGGNPSARIFRVEAGGGPGSVSTYGPSIIDPEPVAYDATGWISGTPGSIVTGGMPAHMSAILPDQTEKVLWEGEPLAFQNPVDIVFDSTGRMLFTDGVLSGGVYQSRNGENPTKLFDSPLGWEIAVDREDNDNIYISCPIDAMVRKYDRNGIQLGLIPTGYEDPYRHQINIPIAIGTGGAWGHDLYILPGYKLVRADSSGNLTTVGTGFDGEAYQDMEFGPDGALYITDYRYDRILRIAPANRAPTANAGPDQTIECACQQGGTLVTLNGTGSSDPDGDQLTYKWTGGFVESPVSGPNPTVRLTPGCQGTYPITLVVNDGKVNSAPDEVVITVRDTTAPSLTCPEDITVVAQSPSGVPASDPAIVAFLQGASVSDNCDPSPVISHDAPDLFPIAATPVTFTATDVSRNTVRVVRTVTVTPPVATVYLKDDAERPRDGECIKVQPAHGGTWGPVFEGVTAGDGSFRCEMEPGYTKIRMTFNQASVEQTVAELTASGYTWTAIPATVKVIDYQGQGIANVKVSQGGSVWVDHGYTNGAGELTLHLFPNKSYKFRVSGSTVSNSSQTAWFPVPGPIQFQTGYVTSAGAAIRASIGGAWVSYTPPGMHILPGSYSFVFSAPTVSPQSVVVTAGAQKDIP